MRLILILNIIPISWPLVQAKITYLERVWMGLCVGVVLFFSVQILINEPERCYLLITTNAVVIEVFNAEQPE